MMSGMSGILYTGLQALLAQQAAVQTVGQNIANVNTPGYSREQPVLVPVHTQSFGGSGVAVDQVKRVYDRFVDLQLQLATSNAQSSQQQADLLSQIETLFNDLEQGESGLSRTLERFFQSFQELAINPQGLAERMVVQQQGEMVTQTFHQLVEGVTAIRKELNGMLQDELKGINHLVSQIADLNLQIQRTETNEKDQANSLRDQRDLLLRELAGKLDITTFETPAGTLTVLVGGSRPLIEGSHTSSLVALQDPDDPDRLTVHIQNSQGQLTEMTSHIRSGKLQGLLEVRDAILPQVTKSLDRLAAQLISTTNQIHSNGYGLDGSTGNVFFAPRTVTTQAQAQNQGGGMVQSATVYDPTQLTLDEYQIVFTSDNLFDVVNTTTGDTVSSGNSYAAGAAIRFEGIEVVLGDNGTPPQIGDRFMISTIHEAAKHIAVDTNILNDPQKIAAAGTPEQGDNTNALALAKLQETRLIDDATLEEFYHALVGSIGLQSQNKARVAEQQQLLVTQMENKRESISGVSLDEEQIELIRFQQAFEAAARFINVVDELGQTVLSLIR